MCPADIVEQTLRKLQACVLSYRQKWITDILGQCTTQNSRRNDRFVETVALVITMNTVTNTIAEAGRKAIISDFSGTNASTVIAKVAMDVIDTNTQAVIIQCVSREAIIPTAGKVERAVKNGH